MENTTPPKRGRGRPATGQTAKRYFRMADEDWQQVETAASLSDQTTSQYVRDVLLNHARRTIKAKTSQEK